MARLPDNDTEPVRLVEFAGRVPASLHEEFISRFPQHGATSWFIRTSLEKFLEEVRSLPTPDQAITAAAKRTLEEQPE